MSNCYNPHTHLLNQAEYIQGTISPGQLSMEVGILQLVGDSQLVVGGNLDPLVVAGGSRVQLLVEDSRDSLEGGN